MLIRVSWVLFILFSCLSCTEGKLSDSPDSVAEKTVGKQLNVSVLWDLSDRINPAIHSEQPSNAERDIAIIKYFAEYLKADMDRKGAYFAKGKLRVFFSPNPGDPNISTLSAQLNIDLSKKDVKQKKEIYDSVAANFEKVAQQIAGITIKTSHWEGSDIYRFFKNDVVDYCIEKDTSYRNILVILTDGYIYDKNSTGRIANKTEYILPQVLSSLGLRNNPNYQSIFRSKNCGLIPTRSDLKDLEILVVEVNSEVNHKDDEDIIKMYLHQWFTEMKVKRFEIYNTDLPVNTNRRIGVFLN
jgi:hypothetical protein